MIFGPARNPPFSRPGPASFRPTLCLGWRLVMKRKLTAVLPCRARRRRCLVCAERRRGDGRHLPQQHGDASASAASWSSSPAPTAPGPGSDGALRIDAGQENQSPAPSAPRSSGATSRSPPPSGCSAARRDRSSARPTSASSCGPAAAPSTSSWSSRCSARRSWSRSPPKARNSSHRQERESLVRLNEANKLRLRAINITSGPEKGQRRTLRLRRRDPGRRSDRRRRRRAHRPRLGVIVGASKGGDGVLGSVDDLVIRVPSPF